MPKRNLTTEKHFKEFKRVARHWIKRLGLTDWQVHFLHEGKNNDVFARCYINVAGRVATLELQKDWDGDKVSMAQVRRSARHEVGELLLLPLEVMAKDRFVSEAHISETQHGIVRRLEKLFGEIGE